MSWSEKWISFCTLLIREIRRFMRIWVQTLIPSAITTTLYFLIFGKLMGERLGEMQGHSYIQFVAPGLIMMAILTNTYANVVSSFFGSKWQKFLEELLVSPTPIYIILLGFILGGAARGVLVGIIVTFVALCFTELPIYSLGVIIITVLLTTILFGLVGMINGIVARNFDDVTIVPTFVLTPLAYLGGIFYSVSLLPEFWENVSKFNPILYIVNAFRYGFLGQTDVNVTYALIAVFIMCVILFGITLHMLTYSQKLRS